MRYDISLVLEDEDDCPADKRLYALNVKYGKIISKNKLKKARKLVKGK